MAQASVITFASKGGPLTSAELDGNFTLLATTFSLSSPGLAPQAPVDPTGLFLAADGTWKSPVGSSGAVQSVNSKTGSVTLTASDVGAVASINGKSGSAVTLTAADVGACSSSDSRLTDSRNPNVHADSHRLGGSDPLRLDDLATPTDSTKLNATTDYHGLMPKLLGDTSKFLRSDGLWAASTSMRLDELAAPTDTTVNNATVNAHGLLPKLAGDPVKFLRSDGTWQPVSAGGGGGAVASVNSKTGTVVLTLPDFGITALPQDSTKFLNGLGQWSVPAGGGGGTGAVASVNGYTGTVILTFGDVGACSNTDARLSDARTPTAHNQAWSTITGTPTTLAGYGITDAASSGHNHNLTNLADVVITTVQNNQVLSWNSTTSKWVNYTLPAAPVTSVNGKTGAVTLTYSDVGAAASVHQHAISDVTGLQTALDGKQVALNGTGFVKISGTTVTYDNSTYSLSTHNHALSSLTGVSISSPANNDVLAYDTATSTWKNKQSALPAHAVTHKSGGSDSIKLDELAAPTDVTTLNASTSAHGLLPKLPNDAAKFLDGQGNWNYPTASSDIVPIASNDADYVAGYTNNGIFYGSGLQVSSSIDYSSATASRSVIVPNYPTTRGVRFFISAGPIYSVVVKSRQVGVSSPTDTTILTLSPGESCVLVAVDQGFSNRVWIGSKLSTASSGFSMTSGTFTPQYTGRTVVNGTGGVTDTGGYVNLGNGVIHWWAKMTVSGTATIAFTAGAQLYNLPGGNPTAITTGNFMGQNYTTQGPVLIGRNGSRMAEFPSLSAVNTTIMVSGVMIVI